MSLSRRELLFGLLRPEPTPATPIAWQEAPPRSLPEAPTGRVARVLPFSCLNNLGGFCGTCIERCPVPEAIVLSGRAPVVGPSCTGCGLCETLCPAPGNAILLVPA